MKSATSKLKTAFAKPILAIAGMKTAFAKPISAFAGMKIAFAELISATSKTISATSKIILEDGFLAKNGKKPWFLRAAGTAWKANSSGTG